MQRCTQRRSHETIQPKTRSGLQSENVGTAGALTPLFLCDSIERSAASFDNPDHVAIVIHNYRWRLGLARARCRHRKGRSSQRLQV
jgi:hypothetical protein